MSLSSHLLVLRWERCDVEDDVDSKTNEVTMTLTEYNHSHELTNLCARYEKNISDRIEEKLKFQISYDDRILLLFFVS